MLHLKNKYLHLSNDYKDIKNFKANAAAAICFIEAENKILMLRHNKQNEDNNPREWGIPGGKLEKNEQPLDAVRREIFEETSLIIDEQELKFILKLYVRIPNFDYDLYIYKTTIHKPIEQVNIVVDNKEHYNFKWCTIKESLQLPLIYEDKELIEYLYPNNTILEV